MLAAGNPNQALGAPIWRLCPARKRGNNVLAVLRETVDRSPPGSSGNSPSSTDGSATRPPRARHRRIHDPNTKRHARRPRRYVRGLSPSKSRPLGLARGLDRQLSCTKKSHFQCPAQSQFRVANKVRNRIERVQNFDWLLDDTI